MKAFVINLERSPDRRAFMAAQLNKQHLDFEFIKATDYKEISEADFERLCDVDSVRKNAFFTKGVLACALSHVEAYKRIIKDNLDMALVLEDDVALGNDFKDLLTLVEEEIAPDEIISFIYYSHYGNISYMSNIDKKQLNKHYSLLFPVNIEEVSCAMAYVITKEVAQRMLEIAVPVYGPADYWGGFFKRKVFSSFRCVSPVPVKPASFRSVINYAAANTVKSKIAAFVRRNKIPILYSYLQKKDKSFIEQKSRIVFSDDLPFIHRRKIEG